ncbi:MAG: helix-hairpin-helix domain-containing protein [Burkholderiales bacterium]|nr:helix-hairpin-helix domain-containing protein [Burkholderiales bacterium]
MIKRLVMSVLTLLAASAIGAVELNSANEAELDSVKGFGPSTTARILQERAKGNFKDWADFMARVRGVKAPAAKKLSDAGLTVNGASYEAPANSKNP